MAITVTELNADQFGFAVNAYSADASGCETVRAAPGAGRSLYLEQLTIVSATALSITLGSGASGGAVESVLIGPIPFTANGMQWRMDFQRPIRLPANKALTVDSSGAGDVCVFVSGKVV